MKLMTRFHCPKFIYPPTQKLNIFKFSELKCNTQQCELCLWDNLTGYKIQYIDRKTKLLIPDIIETLYQEGLSIKETNSE